MVVRSGVVGRVASDGSNPPRNGIGIDALVNGSMIVTWGLAGPSALKRKLIGESTFVSAPMFIVSAGWGRPLRFSGPQ
jgi:hypothetical protein